MPTWVFYVMYSVVCAAFLSVVYAIFAIAMAIPTDEEMRVQKANECAMIWSDFETEMRTYKPGAAVTVYTCMVKIDGKFIPEDNIKVTP